MSSEALFGIFPGLAPVTYKPTKKVGPSEARRARARSQKEQDARRARDSDEVRRYRVQNQKLEGKSLVGGSFGLLTVLDATSEGLRCRCACGAIVIKKRWNLLAARYPTCTVTCSLREQFSKFEAIEACE